MTKLLLLSACFALISHTFVCAEEGQENKDKPQEVEQPAPQS